MQRQHLSLDFISFLCVEYIFIKHHHQINEQLDSQAIQIHTTIPANGLLFISFFLFISSFGWFAWIVQVVCFFHSWRIECTALEHRLRPPLVFTDKSPRDFSHKWLTWNNEKRFLFLFSLDWGGVCDNTVQIMPITRLNDVDSMYKQSTTNENSIFFSILFSQLHNFTIKKKTKKK